MTNFPYPNQGTKIAPNWDAVSLLKNWTAYFGTDGARFLPPNDRSGFTAGIVRRISTGGTLNSGFPIDRLTFPWISDGQIDALVTTLGGGAESANVTVAVHTPQSVGVNDVSNYNAVMNLNLDQIQTLTRRANGYVGFVVELVLVESL